MSNVTIGTSDLNACALPDVLVTYALGSCVGICLYDAQQRIAGMAHIMLPMSKEVAGAQANRMKFADTAIPDLLARMERMGAVRRRITAKIAGGAQMFAAQSERFNIGERNVAAVKMVLAELKIPIIAQDTGLNYGRTVFFYSENGAMEVKAAAKGVRVL